MSDEGKVSLGFDEFWTIAESTLMQASEASAPGPRVTRSILNAAKEPFRRIFEASSNRLTCLGTALEELMVLMGYHYGGTHGAPMDLTSGRPKHPVWLHGIIEGGAPSEKAFRPFSPDSA